MADGNQKDPAAPTGHDPLSDGEGLAPLPDGRQPSPMGKFLGGVGAAAVPMMGLVLIGLIPGLWFFLLLAVPFWLLALLAAVFVMRTEGFAAGLGVLAGCVIGAVAFCVAFYSQLGGIFGT